MMEERLARVRYRVDPIAHISVDGTVCEGCPDHACTLVCPAGCFALEAGTLSFVHDGCLECGSCRIVCGHGAVRWGYPAGGFGVTFRFS